MAASDDLLKQELAARQSAMPKAAPLASDALLQQEVEERRRRSNQVFDLATTVSPDHAAQAQKLAKQFGVDATTAEENRDELARLARVRDLQGAMQASPFLAQQLMDPQFAKLAQDDLPKISALEDALNFGGNLFRSLAASGPGMSEGIYGVAQSGFENAGALLSPLVGTVLPQNPFLVGADKFAALRKTAKATGKAIEGDQAGMGFTQKSVLSGMKSLGQNLLAIPASVLSGSPLPMLATMTTTSAGQAYGEARDKGVSVPGSTLYGTSQGLIEYATEKIPAIALMRDLGLKSSFRKTLVNQLATEIPGEQVATILQDLNEWAVLNPAKPFSAYLAERPSAAAQTLIATMVSTGGQVSIMKAADRAINGPAEQRVVDMLTALKDGAVNSKTFERAPERIKAFIASHVKDGPLENLFIPSSQFATYFQMAGIDAEAAAIEMGATNYAEAVATGGDLVIPLGDFITNVAKTEHYDALLPDIRFRQGDMTARERDLFEKNYPDEVAKMREQMAGMQADIDQKPSINQVRDEIMGQLAGRFDQATSEAYATLYAKTIANLSERSGLDPLALHQKYGMQVIRPMADILTQQGQVDIAIDPLLDRIRAGEGPTDAQINGPSLIDFLRSIGGINDSGGDVRRMEVDRNKGAFVRNLVQLTGHSVDVAASMAREAGYLVDDILSAIDDEASGNPTYSVQQQNEELLRQSRELGSLNDYVQSLGVDLATATNQQVRDAMAAAMAQVYEQQALPDTIEIDGVPRPTTNSNGKPLAQTEQGVRNFWKWFGDSKAVDAQGRPLVAHHGSPKGGFEEFDVSNVGAFFSSRYDIAASYGGSYDDVEFADRGEMQGVYSAYLALKNPMVIDWQRQDWGHGPEGLRLDEWANRAKSAGNDGLIVENVVDTGWLAPGMVEDKGDGDTYVAFEPTQIKSATDNNGQFDPANPNILFQRTPTAADFATLGSGFTVADGQLLRNGALVGEIELHVDGKTLVIDRIDVSDADGLGTIALAAIMGKASQFDLSVVVESPDGLTEQFKRIGFKEDEGLLRWEAPRGTFFQPAYHGTPYHFDKFSLEHLGKGEGAQAFGWGLYFAGNKAIAEYYRRTLSESSDKSTVSLNGVKLEDGSPEHHAARLLYHNDAREMKALAKSMLKDAQEGQPYAIETAQRAGLTAIEYYTRVSDFIGKQKRKEITVAKGQLYEVEIPEDDKLLLWDKPLSGQSQFVREALKAAGVDKQFKGNLSDFAAPQNTRGKGNGSNIYSFLAHARETEATAGLRAERDALIAKYNENGNLIAARTKMSQEDRARESEITAELVALNGTGDKAASLYLNSLGIKGIKYKADTLGPGATGKSGYNYVVFDDAAVEILTKHYQRAAEDKRGFIQFGSDRKFRIGLLEKADLSTFLHEAGHFWLEVMGDMAVDPQATQQVRDDYAAILKFLKVESREQIGTEQHELFARANEAYLREGKSPSPELRAMFQRFKAWLTMIYRSVQQLNVELSDEVRGVFDRIYASDVEIEAAKSEADLVNLFLDAQSAGMSQAEFDAYKGSVDGATAEAKETLQAKLLREFQRERTKWWNEELDKARADVTAEVDQRTDYNAFRTLVEGALPDGTAIKLDKAELVERYGKAFTQKVPRGRHAVYSNKGDGWRLEDAAEILGFESGDALVQALAGLRNRNELIEAEARQRMSDRHGDLMTDGSLADEATAALHNERRADVLRIELQALNRELSGDIVPPLSAFRDAARGLIGQKTDRELQPYAYLLAERKAAREAFTAMAEGGNRIEAFQAKKRELLNHYLYAEAVKAREEMAALASKAADLAKPRAQQRIGKAGADYLNQINALLEQYEFKQVSLATVNRRQNLAMWIEQQEALGLEPAIAPILLASTKVVNYREVAIDELRAVRDALSSIEHLARLKNRLLNKRAKVEFDAIVDEMVSVAEEGNAKVFRPRDKGVRTTGQKAADWLSKIDGELVNVRTMVAWLDGGRADGPWHKYFFNPASDAQSAMLDMTKAVGKPVNDLMDAFLKDRGDRLDDKFATPFGTVNRKWLMSVAFNMGNASNFDKLLRGGPGGRMDNAQRETWTESDVRTLVGQLDAKDWNFIQGMWDILDNEMFPRVSALTQRVSGVPLAKVEAREFTVETKAGPMTLRGGYYPLKYDPAFSDAGAKQEVGPMAGLENGYTPPSTARGHTKDRTKGFAAPIDFDFTKVLSSHLGNVIKDLTHREFFIDAIKILRDDRIRQVIQERIGPQYEAEFKTWLQRIANDGSIIPPSAMTWLDRGVEKFRTNATIVALGYKATTVFAQAAGLTNAMEHPNVGPGWFYRGFTEATKSPLESYALVVEKSGEMRHRFDTIDQTVREVLNSATGSAVGKAKDSIARASFIGINIADRMVTIPTWLAAYRKGIAAGMEEVDAIHAADDAVVGSQGAGGAKDLNKIQGARGATRLFTMFYTPFAAQYNRARSIGRQLRDDGWKYAPEAYMRVMMITFIPAVIADLLTARGPNECEPGDAACYAKWLTAKMFLSPLSMVPGVRELANAAEQYAMGKPANPRLSPLVGAIDKVSKSVVHGFESALGDRPFEAKDGLDIFEASGYLIGLPTAQVRITAENMLLRMNGDEGEHSFLHDLLFRREKK